MDMIELTAKITAYVIMTLLVVKGVSFLKRKGMKK